MKSSAFYAVIGIGALIVIGFIWYGLSGKEPALPEGDSTETALIPVREGSAIYAHGEFSFLILYPESARVEEGSVTAYHLVDLWRDGALSESSGTPIVSFITYTLTNERSYPRYYTTAVRVGVSKDSEELKRCERVDETRGETALPDAVVGDKIFKVFSFHNAGMMQYIKGESYRRLEQGTCYAIERIARGSAYRDDAPSSADTSDAELARHYELTLPIVESFRFAVDE